MRRAEVAAVAAVALACLVPLRLHVAEWRAAAVSRAERLLEDETLRVVIIGDSVAAGSGDETGLGITGQLRMRLTSTAAEITNGAIPGGRTRDMHHAVERLRHEIQRADVVLLSVGGNDLYGSSKERLLSLISPDFQIRRVARRVTHVVDHLQQINPAVSVVLLGLYNPYGQMKLGPLLSAYVKRWDGKLTLAFASNPKVSVVPIADLLASVERLSPLDRFHPGASGYAAIVQRVSAASIFATGAPAN